MERRATGREVDHCIAYARDVSPAIGVLPVSAESGEGVAAWCQWLRDASAAHATTGVLLAEPEAHVA
jgi:hydrogenase nickel incorporation protein HypB